MIRVLVLFALCLALVGCSQESGATAPAADTVTKPAATAGDDCTECMFPETATPAKATDGAKSGGGCSGCTGCQEKDKPSGCGETAEAPASQ